MSRNKSKKPLMPWLSAKPDNKEGRFTQIGNSLLLSPAFKGLSIGARYLYICASDESAGKNKFTFPAKTMKKFGITRSSGVRYIDELENAGLIKCVYRGKAQMKPNEYEFDFSWKNKKPAAMFGFGVAEGSNRFLDTD